MKLNRKLISLLQRAGNWDGASYRMGWFLIGFSFGLFASTLQDRGLFAVLIYLTGTIFISMCWDQKRKWMRRAQAEAVKLENEA